MTVEPHYLFNSRPGRLWRVDSLSCAGMPASPDGTSPSVLLAPVQVVTDHERAHAPVR